MNVKPDIDASSPVKLEIRDDAVGVITLDTPRNGNAIDLELARALMHAMQRCEAAATLRAITIKGSGKIFCSGGDLASIEGQGENAPVYVRELLDHLHEAIAIIAHIPVPVVACVHGAAAGAGLALAASCDLIIAAKSARFVLAYSRVGLTPDGSTTFYLPRLIGMRRALELALSDRKLSADEACDWGLVTEVADDDRLQSRLAQIVASLIEGPTAAYGAAKQLLRTSLDNDLDTQMTREADSLCQALTSPEANEGLSAFLAKRAPKYRR